ncbi:protein tesmin/TSO1-like CXC 3 isoform X1 [Juglans microcarpa x Juglans regia]|uniref:protein tesmin/TSO1-like CXC 3 isoform X1 n=1 Tax=Juglans microcarpa x Juglans regia TaxID=2249226 RepID=UPI001B7EAAB1|nr:protein tesmin/TSO1-like CXC 3 isoform X1 [Juglans microcarpa x Juglans regia]
MDTPERNQIGTPISKFEDSPVFNYINSLSPIKPDKSIHITQTFNPLNFASLPSVFTSPHVNSHKESRFLKRHNCLDLSKPESSSGNGNKIGTNEGTGVDAAQLHDNSAELQENFDSEVSLKEASVQPPSEHSKFVIELPCTLKYDCGSPECGVTLSCDFEIGCMSELVSKSASLIQYGQEASGNGSSEGEVHLSEMCRIGQKKEGMECDWESLISDATDLLIFNSPNYSEAFKGSIQKSTDPRIRFSTSLMSELHQNDIKNLQTMQIVDPIGSGEQYETDNPSAETGEGNELQEIEQTQDNAAESNLSKGMSSHMREQVESEVAECIPYASKAVSNLHRGMRRRCLDFEMAGARRKALGDASNFSSSMLSQPDEKITYYDKQLVAIKPGGDSSRCILPGIGLHLNALATTSKDHKNVKHESLSSGIQLYLPSSTASLHSPTNSQEPLHKSLTSVSAERDTDLAENGVSHVEDASQASAYLVSEELNQNSPKKKRRRLEHAGESESCKRCNCKKSKCLKLYCECFAAGVYCIEPCSCQECFNKPIHEDTVLATRKQIESRNPLAFAPKVIRSSESVTEIGDESSKTPASARHKRGCNCKKSNCLKKYCECYQGGVGCSISCRCEGCKNAFGRKDGCAPIGTEADIEEETDACEMEKAIQKSDIQNNEEQNPATTLPTTPLRLSRPLVPLPFSSNGKLSRSSFLTVGPSSGLYTSQKLGKLNILRSLPKLERRFQTVPEDEMPEILCGDSSPSTGIKSASPNSKRVSPPHGDFGSSPSRRSGRKLILQSIPSFPSLTPKALK